MRFDPILASAFWDHLRPWLITAIAVPAWIVLSSQMTPSDEWTEGIIRDWADSEGFKIAAIDEALWFGHVPDPSVLSRGGSASG